jgi:hypothetical protein
MIAGRPRTIRTPDNEYAIIAAVDRQPWRSWSYEYIAWELVLTKCSRSTSRRSIVSLPLFMELTSVSRRSYSTDVVGYDIHWSSLFKYGQTKHVLCVRLCSRSTAVTPGHGIIFMLSTNVGNKSGLASLGCNRRGYCHGPLSAAWQADCSTTSWFSAVAAWMYASSCEAELLRNMGKISTSGRMQHIKEAALDVEGWLQEIIGFRS